MPVHHLEVHRGLALVPHENAQFEGITRFSGCDMTRFEDEATLGNAWFDKPGIYGLATREAWVRLDVADTVLGHRCWPPGYVVREVEDRPEGYTEGRWGRLLEQRPPQETDPAPAESGT
ncbi:hypothetical protein GCM10010174_00220 [Kutzneria viridogrisea]|uniref:Uncharacterized protein n=1 Tax=Kutzneria viridogrisea TaxID=47990 RepID=A0ABR6BCC8_9PSEU|nr:hypothetical protein [Kutzneria viridogrisea]